MLEGKIVDGDVVEVIPDFIWVKTALAMKYFLYFTYATMALQCCMCIMTCGAVGLPKIGGGAAAQ